MEKCRHFLYAKLINIEAIMVLKTTFIGFKNNTTLKTFLTPATFFRYILISMIVQNIFGCKYIFYRQINLFDTKQFEIHIFWNKHQIPRRVKRDVHIIRNGKNMFLHITHIYQKENIVLQSIF